MDNEDDGYRVGPRRPPRKFQFKKGQSGNPRGRPAGALNLKTMFLKELAAEVALKNGERILASQAVVRRLVRLAVEGHLRAIESVLDRAERYQAGERERPSELPEADAEILRRLGFSGAVAPTEQHEQIENTGSDEQPDDA